MKKILFALMTGLIGLNVTLVAAGENKMQEMTKRADSGNAIVLIFYGEPDTSYKASLKVYLGGQVTTHELEESVPSEYRYQGEVLEAIVRQTSLEGALTVEVHKGGNVSRSSTSGKNSEMRLNVR